MRPSTTTSFALLAATAVLLCWSESASAMPAHKATGFLSKFRKENKYDEYQRTHTPELTVVRDADQRELGGDIEPAREERRSNSAPALRRTGGIVTSTATTTTSTAANTPATAAPVKEERSLPARKTAFRDFFKIGGKKNTSAGSSLNVLKEQTVAEAPRKQAPAPRVLTDPSAEFAAALLETTDQSSANTEAGPPSIAVRMLLRRMMRDLEGKEGTESSLMYRVEGSSAAVTDFYKKLSDLFADGQQPNQAELRKAIGEHAAMLSEHAASNAFKLLFTRLEPKPITYEVAQELTKQEDYAQLFGFVDTQDDASEKLQARSAAQGKDHQAIEVLKQLLDDTLAQLSPAIRNSIGLYLAFFKKAIEGKYTKCNLAAFAKLAAAALTEDAQDKIGATIPRDTPSRVAVVYKAVGEFTVNLEKAFAFIIMHVDDFIPGSTELLDALLAEPEEEFEAAKPKESEIAKPKESSEATEPIAVQQ